MKSSVVANTDLPLEIKPKMKLSGNVVKLSLAGAIVDIGTETPAVIHISQILSQSGKEPVNRVEDVLKVGQTVDVWVRRIKDEHIELTMIKPLDMEWREIRKGMTVKGTVTRLENFGAFIEIGTERPGLIHISEMSHEYIREASDVVKVGDEVETQVLEVNRRKKQIRLSIKALQSEPEVEEESEETTRVRNKSNHRKKTNRNEKARKGRSKSVSNKEESSKNELEPTAMGVALQEAIERSKGSKMEIEEKSKKNKIISKEQEDILARTLEHKTLSS